MRLESKHELLQRVNFNITNYRHLQIDKMASMTTKMIYAFYYSLLGGKLFLQIPGADTLINMDRVNEAMFNWMLAVTFSLWVIKYLISLYEKWRDVKNKKY